MNPNDPNYPPGLSPQLDPTITPQAAPGAPPPPGLFSTGMQGHVFGQHEARLQSNDIAAGYVAGGITGAAEAGLRAGQLFGVHSEIARMAADHAFKAAEGMNNLEGDRMFARAQRFRRMQVASGAFTMDPMFYGRLGAQGGTGLANIIGSPFGVRFGSEAAQASQMGRAVGSTRLARFAGTAGRIGMRLPGAVGGVASFGLSLAAQEAAIQSVGQIYEGHADRMRSATMLNQTAGISGVSFSQAEARGADMTGMAAGMGMEFEEFSGLSQMLAQGGSFQGVNNLQEFKAKLRSSLQQLKQIAEVTNTTLQEAGQIGQALKQQGFSGGQLPQAAAQAFGLGQATGLGAGAFVQMGGMGAQYGAATNMGMARGSAMFQQALGGVEFAMQRGAFSQEMIQRMGGSSSSATMALMQGTMGQAGMMGTTVSQMMGFIAKKGEGEYSTPIIDQEKLERLLNGNVTRQELAAVSQSQQVLGMSTAIQRAAMPQVNQMLHSTLSSGTSSPEEYLRKAEMMGIPPDVAKLIMETEQNRDLTSAATQLAVGQNMAQQSIARSQNSGGFVGRLFSGNLGVGDGSFSRFGAAVSEGTFNLYRRMGFGGERAALQPSATGRDLMRSVLAEGADLDVSVADVVALGSGSGNPFNKGRGEALREARYREFETLFSRAPRAEGRRSEDGLFGETTFTRRVVDRQRIDDLVAARQTFKPSEEQVDRARMLLNQNNVTTRTAMQNLGLNRFTSIAHRSQREELVTISLAEQMGLIDKSEMNGLRMSLMAPGVDLTESQQNRLQILKGRVFETASQAGGFDLTNLIGSDITAASLYGGISPESILEDADAAVRALNLGEGVEALLTGDSALGNIQAMRGFRTEINRLVESGGLTEEQAIVRVLGRSGLQGEQLTAATKFARGGFQGLDDLSLRHSAAQYRRTVDPIAAGQARIAEREFAGAAAGTFEKAAFTELSAFGEAGLSPGQRRDIMTRLLERGLVGDDSLRNEAELFRARGLRDVERLANTVEMLVDGDKERITAEGFDPAEFEGLDRKGIIGKLGEKGLLSGIAGAQAAASAGQSLEGRSLAGDLLAFSQNVDGLAAVVRQMQIDLDMVESEAPPPAADPADPNSANAENRMTFR